MQGMSSFLRVVRHFNTVLFIIRLLLLTPLFIDVMSSYSALVSLYMFALALFITLIWTLIEYCLKVDEDKILAGITRGYSGLTEVHYRKIKKYYDQNVHSSDLYAVLLDPILFLSVMWSLVSIYLESTGYVYRINPHVLIIIFSGFIVITACYASINQSEHDQSNQKERQFLTEYFNVKQSQTSNHQCLQHRKESSLTSVWLYRLFALILGLATYCFVQLLMPLHHVLGPPALLSLCLSAIVTYWAGRLHEKGFLEICFDLRPYLIAASGFQTLKLMLQNAAILWLGWPLKIQSSDHIVFFKVVLVISFIFGLALFCQDCNNVWYDPYRLLVRHWRPEQAEKSVSIAQPQPQSQPEPEAQFESKACSTNRCR